MPMRPKQHKPRGYEQQRKAARREYDKEHQEDRSFYWSPAWRAVRARQLADFPLCEWCDERGHVTAASQVDHRKPRRDYPELSLEPSNLRSGCESCHARYGAKSSTPRRQ